MAKLDENNLKPEELYGGFESDINDDLFYLERDDSVAVQVTDLSENIREISENPVELEPIQEPSTDELIDTQEIVNPDLSEQDFLNEFEADTAIGQDQVSNADFDVPNSEEVINPIDQPNDIDDLLKGFDTSDIDFSFNIKKGEIPKQDVIEDLPFNENINSTTTSNFNEIEDLVSSTDQENDNSNINLVEGGSTIESQSSIEIPEQVEIDDDLLKLIEADLKKPRKAKNRFDRNQITNEVDKEQNAKSLSEFQSVDNQPDAELIDLSKIDAEHPSTYSVPVEDNVPSETELPDKEILKKDNKVKQPKPAKEKAIKKEISEEEKKKRKFLIVLLSSLLLGLGIIGIATYLLFFKHPNINIADKHIQKKDTTNKVHLSANKNEHLKDKIQDTLKRDTTHTGISKENQNRKEINTENTAESKKVVAPVAKEQLTEKKEITREKKPIVKKIKPEKEPGKKVLASHTEKIKKHEPIKDPERKVLSKEESYSIEVYSTPVFEDAETWVSKLEKRNISARIQQQIIKGLPWYKIRIGDYKTKQEAKEAAMKLGFSRSWIDRVR